jgi:hypothetical protein
MQNIINRFSGNITALRGLKDGLNDYVNGTNIYGGGEFKGTEEPNKIIKFIDEKLAFYEKGIAPPKVEDRKILAYWIEIYKKYKDKTDLNESEIPQLDYARKYLEKTMSIKQGGSDV